MTLARDQDLWKQTKNQEMEQMIMLCIQMDENFIFLFIQVENINDFYNASWKHWKMTYYVLKCILINK
jgi:hypothetical protein